MTSVVAKDRQNRQWFKSDQNITDITQAIKFYVKKSLFRSKYRLYAMHTEHRNEFNIFIGFSERKNIHTLIGTYDSKEEASVALGEILEAKGMIVS